MKCKLVKCEIMALEHLFESFVLSRRIRCKQDEENPLVTRSTNGSLDVTYCAPSNSNPEFLDIEKGEESACIYLNFDDGAMIAIEIRAACLVDYLTLLSREKSLFAQKVRDHFEVYLDEYNHPTKWLEKEFKNTSEDEALHILNCFYPK